MTYGNASLSGKDGYAHMEIVYNTGGLGVVLFILAVLILLGNNFFLNRLTYITLASILMQSLLSHLPYLPLGETIWTIKTAKEFLRPDLPCLRQCCDTS